VGTLRERRRASSRQQILEEARGVLARVGPVRLTLELVAAELGMTKQALYYYYPSRSALLIELAVEELLAVANEVNVACAAAPDGASALEALIRTYVGHFLPRLDLHRLITIQFHERDELAAVSEPLARIRPINDLLYGEIEAKLQAEAPGRRRGRRARRLAFTAHLAALGLLTMRAIVEKLDDPLLHDDAALIDELCRTFRAAAHDHGRRA
jgi:AcrR family transcriptional regulator